MSTDTERLATESLDEHPLREQADYELGTRSVSGSIAQILLLGFFFLASGLPFRPPPTIILLAIAVFGFNLLRLILGKWQERLYPQREPRWRRLFGLCIIGSAAAWGTLFFKVLQSQGLSSYATGVCFLIGSGICAAVTTSLSSNVFFARSFISLVLGIPLLHLLAREDRQAIIVSAIFVIYYFFLLAQIRIQSHTYSQSIEFRMRAIAERNRLKDVLDAIPGLVAWLGSDQKLHGVNRNYASSYGGSPEDYVGQPFSFRHEADDVFNQAVSQFINHTATNELAQELEIDQHGQRRSHLVVIRKCNGSHDAYLVAIDTHDLKLAQAKLEEQRIKSGFSSKLAALGEISSGVAHEIKNPLTAVKSSIELLKKELHDPSIDAARLETLASKAIQTCGRIEKITTGLTRFARRSENEPPTVNPVSQIIRDSIDLVQQHFRTHRIPLQVSPIDENLMIQCNAVEISQVLVNLLMNALDAVKGNPGAWVRVECTGTPEDHITVSVVDSGTGLPPDVQENLFSPFFTTKPSGQGTGLGLSVSRSITERHDGTLEYDGSAPNTTFRVVFPAIKSKRTEPTADVA